MKERLVNIMGGSVIETESERLMCMGAAKMVVELGQHLYDGDFDEMNSEISLMFGEVE